MLLPASAAPPSLDDGRHRTHASGAGKKVYADILGNTTLLRLLEVHFAHEYVLMRLRENMRLRVGVCVCVMMPPYMYLHLLCMVTPVCDNVNEFALREASFCGYDSMLIPVFALVCANMVVRHARASAITYMPARARVAVMIWLFLLYPCAYPCGGADYTLRMHSMISSEGNYRGHGSTTMNPAPRTYNWIPPAHTFIPGGRQYYVLSLGRKSSELTVLTMARACIYTVSTQVHARRPSCGAL